MIFPAPLLRFLAASLVMVATACASTSADSPATTTTSSTTTSSTPAAPAASGTTAASNTYDKDTVIREASGVFGKGAEGLGKIVEKVFNDLGEPNAYIVGKEISGAAVVGLRYGDGTLYHKIEGERTVHWTGPSIGFDFGGDASKTFTLVYNLQDTEELFQRFPAVEGKVFLIGGFAVSYHQRGNVIIAPIRLGAGWRLGVNAGYVNYTKKRQYLPL